MTTSLRSAVPDGRAVADAELAFRLWTTALAVGVLLHEIQFGRSPASWHGLVVLSAVLLLARPGSVARLMLLFGAVGIELVTDLPNPWNHTMFLGSIGVAVLAHWAFDRLRGHAPSCGELYLRIGPLLRTSFVFIWLAAAFAKLNSAFVETPDSCAIWLVETVPGVSVPEALGPVVVHGTLAVELAVPMLLLIRRTRLLGIALGWGFHVVAALAGHTAFSGIAWAMYLLFVNEAVLVDVRELAFRRVRRIVERLGTPSQWRRLRDASGIGWTVVLVAVVALLVAFQILPSASAGRARRWIPVLVFLPWAAAWTAALVAVVRRRGSAASVRPAQFVPRAPLLGLGILFLVLNATSPYIGLKTLSSFTMYSDLRTEPGTWNHWLVPESVRVFDWQADPIRVHEIDDPALSDALGLDEGDQMPALAVRVAADGFPDATVTYEDRGGLVRAAPLDADPIVGADVSRFQMWFGAMRTFGSERRCQV